MARRAKSFCVLLLIIKIKKNSNGNGNDNNGNSDDNNKDDNNNRRLPPVGVGRGWVVIELVLFNNGLSRKLA